MVMSEMYVSAAIALVVAGVTMGAFMAVCLGINRDDRPGGFPAQTNDPVARAARRITGVGTRRQASRRQDILPV